MKHTHFQKIVLLTAALLVPFEAIAAAQMTVNDSIAGLGMTVNVRSMTNADGALLSVQNPNGKETTLPVQTDAQGNTMVNVSGKHTQTAGTYTVALKDNSKTLASASVAVLPETMDPAISELQSWTPRIRADGSDTADLSVTLRDRYGNILPGRPVALVSSRNADRITALTPETGKDGTQHFSLKTDESGTAVIRAVDLLSGNTLTSTVEIQAGTQAAMGGTTQQMYAASTLDNGRRFYAQVGSNSFDLVYSFDIVAPTTLPLGEEAQKVVIRAMDRNGNTVENYVGTVVFESTDPLATLPNFGTYTFKDRDLGQKSFPLVLTFKTPGEQIFRVTDRGDPSIEGSATILVQGGNGQSANGITLTSHKDGDAVNSLDILVTGKGPRYANLIVMGGIQDAVGMTDADGAFAIPVTLSDSQQDFTLRVQDDTRQNDSGSIHLTLDRTPPAIGGITFSPGEPTTGEKVLAVVESDPGLSQITIAINEQVVTLTESSAASGSYQGFFTAPEGGSYQPAVTAIDKAGNKTEVRTTFNVGAQSLPTVQNLTAEARVNAVGLQWDPLNDATIDGYRVYVGESPENFLYTLDTGRVTTKATVAGLTPGRPYYFAVTAVKGSLESGSKSDIAQVIPLGLSLDVVPGDSSLQIKWTSLSTDLPLSAFTLEYGTAEETYTETRTLNAGLRDFTIRDLINGVPYFIRLVPVTVTGDTLEDLAAKGQGTPDGSGFHAGPNDPVPGNLGTTPGGVNPAPGNPTTGLPTAAWMIVVFLGLAGALYGWHRRTAARHTDAFLAAIQSQYHR